MPGRNVAEGLIEYARANNFTHLIIAKSRRPRWSEWLRGSVTHQLIRQADDISVHVIAGRETDETKSEPDRVPVTVGSGRRQFADPNAYLGSAGFVAVALGIGVALQQFLEISNIALVFLTAVLASAMTYGLLAVAVRLPRQRAGLQLLLSAAALHLHDRRSGERRRAVLLRPRGGNRQQSHRAHSCPGGHGAPARQDHRGSLPVQPQARRDRRHSTICCGRRRFRSPRC